MKVLLASQAIAGHFNPMTGIAMALKGAGHDVAFYTGHDLAGKLAELDVRHFPFVRAVEHTADNLNELYPQRARLKGPMAIRFDGEKIFASNVSSFFEDIREIHAGYAFDVLVMDSSMFIQRLVSALLHKPVVSFVAIGNMESDPWVPPLFFGFLPARDRAQRLLHAGARLLSKTVVEKPARSSYVRQLENYGLHTPRDRRFTDEAYLFSSAVIQTGTASLDFPRSKTNPKVKYVGALLPYRRAGAAAGVHLPEGFARTVVVTQGTVDNKDPNKLIVPALEALQGRDVLVVVATGGAGTQELRQRYPGANIVVEDFVDFEAVFPRTDVFVTNGGFGGVLLSLSHGVPVVAAGINEGKNDVNARIEYAGVGINLRTDAPSSDAIAKAVDTVLADPSWRDRAHDMRRQFEAVDGCAAAADIIEAAAGAKTLGK
ncbi:glycosyltransferase [Arthrobacter sp. HLT1-20]